MRAEALRAVEAEVAAARRSREELDAAQQQRLREHEVRVARDTARIDACGDAQAQLRRAREDAQALLQAEAASRRSDAEALRRRHAAHARGVRSRADHRVREVLAMTAVDAAAAAADGRARRAAEAAALAAAARDRRTRLARRAADAAALRAACRTACAAAAAAPAAAAAAQQRAAAAAALASGGEAAEARRAAADAALRKAAEGGGRLAELAAGVAAAAVAADEAAAASEAALEARERELRGAVLPPLLEAVARAEAAAASAAAMGDEAAGGDALREARGAVARAEAAARAACGRAAAADAAEGAALEAALAAAGAAYLEAAEASTTGGEGDGAAAAPWWQARVEAHEDQAWCVEERMERQRLREAAAMLGLTGDGGGGGGDPRLEAKYKTTAALLESERAEGKAREGKLRKEVKRLEQAAGGAADVTRQLEEAEAGRAEAEAALKTQEERCKTLAAAQGDIAEVRAENKELKEAAVELKRLAVEKDDTLRTEMGLRKKYFNEIQDLKGKIRVMVRCRPMNSIEKKKESTTAVDFPDENTINVPKKRRDYNFDYVFNPESHQESLWAESRHLVRSAVDGYNTCIFAYGQTGAGKTFTMEGSPEMPGITPRCINEVFELLEGMTRFTHKVSCYMLELYVDNLYDLLLDRDTLRDDAPALDLKKDARGVMGVVGATVEDTATREELAAAYMRGCSQRKTRKTGMNEASSRSHLVFGIVVETTHRSTGRVTTGKMSLVDLAGSERMDKTGITSEAGQKEAKSINKSLTALGDVIAALSTDPGGFIPYRNNKLTLLMSDSLGGNSKTMMIANVSPASYNCDETVNTLTVWLHPLRLDTAFLRLSSLFLCMFRCSRTCTRFNTTRSTPPAPRISPTMRRRHKSRGRWRASRPSSPSCGPVRMWETTCSRLCQSSALPRLRQRAPSPLQQAVGLTREGIGLNTGEGWEGVWRLVERRGERYLFPRALNTRTRIPLITL